MKRTLIQWLGLLGVVSLLSYAAFVYHCTGVAINTNGLTEDRFVWEIPS